MKLYKFAFKKIMANFWSMKAVDFWLSWFFFNPALVSWVLVSYFPYYYTKFQATPNLRMMSIRIVSLSGTDWAAFLATRRPSLLSTSLIVGLLLFCTICNMLFEWVRKREREREFIFALARNTYHHDNNKTHSLQKPENIEQISKSRYCLTSRNNHIYKNK